MDDGMGGANHVPVRVCAKLGDEGTYPHQAQIPVACRCMHHLRTSCICKYHLDQTLRMQVEHCGIGEPKVYKQKF